MARLDHSLFGYCSTTVLNAVIIETRWALESMRFGIGSRIPRPTTLTTRP
jgi:hypothetical protein